MKRFLAGLVSLSLILLTPPPAAWAQFAEAARSASLGAGVSAGAQAGAARLGAAAQIPSLGASALTATSLTSFSAASAPLAVSGPSAFAPAAAIPAAAVLPAAAAKAVLTPVAVPVVAVPAAETNAVSVRAGLVATSRALNAPNAKPETALESLFTGARRLAGLADAAAPALTAAPSAPMSGLEPSSQRAAAADGPNIPSPLAPQAPRRSRLAGALITAARIGAAAAVAVGLNAAAVAFAPALFGVVPVAAVWAVSSGVLLFPAALYARYRLAKRDSPRLDKVKILMDVALGLYAGALVVAAPSLAVTLTSAGLLTSILPVAGLAVGLSAKGAPFLNSVLVWGALGLTPLAVGAAAVGGLAVAPLLGMLALPAMTTIAFFLGSLIRSAESGRPFAVPGSLQKMRFPSFQWVMIGVVFALLTGYGAVHTNIAFLAWNLLGMRTPSKWDKTAPLWKNVLNKAASFDVVYLGLLAFSAATGFASPLTFLVIAFSGERAAVWSERLLTRFLPRGNPAPSALIAPLADEAADKPSAWPRYHYWAKTVGIIAAMAGVGVMMGLTVFGFHSLLTSMLPAVLLAAVPFWFATRIIKLVMHDKPADEAHDPEFFAIMHGLRDKINAKRRVQGKKEIPMPEMVNDPLPLPNAYATGRSPFHALVGVTAGIKEMTLDPENVREGVARLMANVNPGTKSFKVFRLAISGSITGVTEESSPADIQAAVLKADRVELKALGVRMLTGVLGHEFSHVMDRHMLSGAIAGAVSSSIAFASYGVMWAVGHAQVAVKKAFDAMLGRRAPETGPQAKSESEENEGGSKTLVADPISVGVAVKSLPALLKLFAALWVPVLVQIVQMASSRNNEGMADEDGALLSEDPQSLALALGLLTTWRPKTGFILPGTALPRVVALSHLMTVNPVEQAYQAGALPKLDAFTSAVVGKGDDFLFDLFVTHPDTTVRIEKLSDMADALKASKPSRARPPSGDGGGGGTPLAFAPSAAGTAPSSIGGGLFRGAWEKLKRFYRVLPDEGRNRAFWHYTFGQALVTLGADFHYTALPDLVAPAKADAHKLGENRAVNWAAQAVSSLSTGPLVDRRSLKPTLVWTHLGRAGLMALIPVLFATGHLGFAAFCLLIGLSGFLQAASQTAGSVAFNRILGEDEGYYNRANAISTVVAGVVGVVGPLLAGAFIAWAGTFFAAPLMGNALAYGVYAVLLLMTGVGYGLFLNLPRDEVLQARRDLLAKLKDSELGGVRIRGVSAIREKGRTVLLVESPDEPARVSARLPAEWAGYEVRAAPARNPVRELIQGFKLAFSHRFLRLYMLLSALSMVVGDSLTFVVLPRYLADVLHAGPGAFGLFLAAIAAGTGLASGLIALARDPARLALAPAARELRASLAARDPELEAARLDRAAAALRESVPAVLDRYQEEWAAGRGRARTASELAADVLAEAAPELARVLDVAPEEAAALLEATGAARDVRVWAALRGLRLAEGARRDAASGMDHLQRQGRWTNFLHAGSWAAYAGVFLMHALWPSLGLMFLTELLAGAATIVWASLTTRVISNAFPNDQGKVYGALTFFGLICSIAGVLGFSWLMTAVPTATAVLIVAGVLGACALFDVWQSVAIFPIVRPARR